MVYLSSQCGALGHRIFRNAQLFAVFPFRLKHDGLVLDPVLLVYSMVMNLVMGIHLMLIEETSRFIGAVVAYFAVVFHLIIVLFKKDKLNAFLKLISECEFSFLQLGTKSVIKTNDVLDCLLIASNVLSCFIEATLNYDVTIATFFRIWLRLNIVSLVHPFFHFVFVMQRMFSNLNKIIQDCSHYKGSRFRHLTELHQRCITACIILNGCFTHQVLWTTGIMFLYLTSTCYRVFIVIEAGAGFFVVVINVYNLLYYIFIAYIVCGVCEKTSTEVNTTQFFISF